MTKDQIYSKFTFYYYCRQKKRKLLNRIPEAALMARSYLPSKVSEIVAIWRKDLNKVNPKAAESLADPEECPNEDWQVALAFESKAAETMSVWKMLIFLHVSYCFDSLCVGVLYTKHL